MQLRTTARTGPTSSHTLSMKANPQDCRSGWSLYCFPFDPTTISFMRALPLPFHIAERVNILLSNPFYRIAVIASSICHEFPSEVTATSAPGPLLPCTTHSPYSEGVLFASTTRRYQWQITTSKQYRPMWHRETTEDEDGLEMCICHAHSLLVGGQVRRATTAGTATQTYPSVQSTAS